MSKSSADTNGNNCVSSCTTGILVFTIRGVTVIAAAYAEVSTEVIARARAIFSDGNSKEGKEESNEEDLVHFGQGCVCYWVSGMKLK